MFWKYFAFYPSWCLTIVKYKALIKHFLSLDQMFDVWQWWNIECFITWTSPSWRDLLSVRLFWSQRTCTPENTDILVPIQIISPKIQVQERYVHQHRFQDRGRLLCLACQLECICRTLDHFDTCVNILIKNNDTSIWQGVESCCMLRSSQINQSITFIFMSLCVQKGIPHSPLYAV